VEEVKMVVMLMVIEEGGDAFFLVVERVVAEVVMTKTRCF
jgi:hypothetical protein